jgi:hypothetical protein
MVYLCAWFASYWTSARLLDHIRAKVAVPEVQARVTDSRLWTRWIRVFPQRVSRVFRGWGLELIRLGSSPLRLQFEDKVDEL